MFSTASDEIPDDSESLSPSAMSRIGSATTGPNVRSPTASPASLAPPRPRPPQPPAPHPPLFRIHTAQPCQAARQITGRRNSQDQKEARADRPQIRRDLRKAGFFDYINEKRHPNERGDNGEKARTQIHVRRDCLFHLSSFICHLSLPEPCMTRINAMKNDR